MINLKKPPTMVVINTNKHNKQINQYTHRQPKVKMNTRRRMVEGDDDEDFSMEFG